MTDNYYHILGVEENATADEIRQSYRKLALELHPDKGGNIEQFQNVQEAYECLSNSETKNTYDRELHYVSGNNMNQYDMDSFLSHIFQHGIPPNSNPNFGFGAAANTNDDSDLQDANIELMLNITLMDVYTKQKKIIEFSRFVIVNSVGNTVKDLREGVTWIRCISCGGTGTRVQVINHGFIMQRAIGSCSACNSLGYNFIGGHKILSRKGRFTRELPYGIQDDDIYTLDNDGSVVYNKQKKIFQAGNIIITMKYDINETNRQLKKKYNFPHIYISDVHLGTIEYTYEASVFEFITGTTFNLPRPDGRYLLIYSNNLNIDRIIKGTGLPQKISINSSDVLFGDIKINFINREFKNNICLTYSDRLILKNLMKEHYPEIVAADAITVKFNN